MMPARIVWASLLLLATLLVLARIHTYHEPFQNDIAYYAITAHEILNGRPLYSDLIDHKPPFLYAPFLLAECLVGYGPPSIFLINVTAACVTLIALFFVGR